MIDLNYTIGNIGPITTSATGSTLQSAAITTSGFPVRYARVIASCAMVAHKPRPMSMGASCQVIGLKW